MSAVYVWPFVATSTMSIMYCLWTTYCWWSVAAQTRSKLPCMLQLPMRVADAAALPSWARSSYNIWMRSFKIYGIWGRKQAKQAYIHTHLHNAVLLVWGSLRLAPVNPPTTHMCLYTITFVHTLLQRCEHNLPDSCTHAFMRWFIYRDNGQTEGKDTDRGECPVGTPGGRRRKRVWSRSHICLLQWYLCPCNRSLRKVNARLWFVCMVCDYMLLLLL